MSSVTKTLELLAFFSELRPEIGLSQMCRLAKRDKATTYRHLQALEDMGFVEQSPASKQYRLGPAVLQLAQVRELTVPRKSGAKSALETLCRATGETSHVSVLSGTTLYPLMSCESDQHSTRVIIDSDTLPLHATASGHCALAFGPSELFDFAAGSLTRFTSHTVQDAQSLTQAIENVRKTGVGRTFRHFEDEVSSLSAPLFDQTGLLAGAVSVASVASRFTPEVEPRIQDSLILAAREITRNWGGTIPSEIEAAWAITTSRTPTLESAS